MTRLPLLATSALVALALPLAAQQAAETKAPNAPDQSPAFAGQTRAPQPATAAKVAQETVAKGLPMLWALEFLPDGRMLVTAKEGEMYIVRPDGESTEISGVPEVEDDGQGGLLDVALAPDFASSGRIYLSYAEPREGGNGTTLAAARLVTEGDGGRLEDVTVLFRQMPTYDGDKHFGSRIVPKPDGTLYLTVGERSDAPVRTGAQDLASGYGKVFHLTAEGAPATGNPFAGTEGALPEIWSLGHRNVQSAALDGEGRLWLVEHGPKGGDELNRPEAGKNYGWPEVTYGIEYSGRPVGAGVTQTAETEQPLYYWDPVIAPSGMAFYDAALIPEWEGAFLVGGLVTQGLVVLHLDGDRVTSEERLPLEARIRDVKVGPDGAVYAVTENRAQKTSTILRIAPDVGG